MHLAEVQVGPTLKWSHKGIPVTQTLGNPNHKPNLARACPVVLSPRACPRLDPPSRCALQLDLAWMPPNFPSF